MRKRNAEKRKKNISMIKASRNMVLLLWVCLASPAIGVKASGEVGEIVSQQPVAALYEDGTVVGFIGDSITHARYCEVGYVDVLNQYYLTRFPDRQVELRCLGTAGYKARDILHIYELDPGFRGLDKAVIMLGTNEAILGDTTETYIRDMEKLIGKLKEEGLSGQDITVMTPPICDEYYAAGSMYRFEGTILEYIEALEEKIPEWGVQYLDIHTPMMELTQQMRQEDSGFTLTTKDGIHPSVTGQHLIAALILQAQGVQGIESTIQNAETVILYEESESVNEYAGETEETVLQEVEQEELTDYRGEKGMYWTVIRDTLPFAATEALLDSLALYEPAGDLYRESLVVEGFAADTVYQVLIDDVEIGRFTGAELEKGIDLGVLSAHPMQETMQQLDTLNRQRHKAAVNYRDIWIEVMMQRASYTKRQAQAKFDSWQIKDKGLQEELWQLARSAQGTTYRMAILEEGYSMEQLEADRLREEEQTRKEAEEKAIKEAQERAQKEAREKAKKAAQEQALREAREREAQEAALAAKRERVLKGVAAAMVAAVTLYLVRRKR